MPAAKLLPSQEYLQECFLYEPLTGSLIWRERPRNHFDTTRGWNTRNTRYAGKPAGSICNRKYATHVTGLDYRLRATSRIIFKLMTGRDPIEVDHIDKNATNLKWSNMRECNRSQNNMNKRAHTDSTTGLKGVSYDKNRGKYEARIAVNKKQIHLGRFSTAEEAYVVYCEAAQRLHKDFYSP